MSAEITEELIIAARTYSCAFRRRYPWVDPEDALAEAHYSLVYECARFDPTKHPGGNSHKALLSWLYQRINWHLERVFGQALRTAKRTATVVGFEDLGPEQWDRLNAMIDRGQQSPQRIAEARDELSWLLADLHPRDRLAVLLEAEECQQAEIGEALGGISYARVQQILERAHQRLRRERR